jgi:hypothetical protein
VIDLHTANASKPYLIIGGKSYIGIVKNFGLKHNYLLNFNKLKNGDNGTFTGSLIENGRASSAVDCRSHDEFGIV